MMVVVASGACQMAVTVNGIYKNGQLTLTETPAGIAEGPVEITLSNVELPSQRIRGFLRRGMYHKEGGVRATWDDFMETKKEWDSER